MTTSEHIRAQLLEAEIAQKKTAEPIRPVEFPEELVQYDAITADLMEEYVRLNLGKGYHKIVTYADFVQTLLSLVDKEEASSQRVEYILPQGVFYMSTSLTEIKLSLYYPETIRNLTYRTTTQPCVIPNIIISHTLVKRSKDWSVLDTRYLCTNKKLLELRRDFYTPQSVGVTLMPFTNVYNDGKLCYGSNQRVASINPPDFKALHWYYEMLFTSPFNDDLGIYAMSKEPYRSDYRAWYAHLADLAKAGNPFPYNYLRGFD